MKRREFVKNVAMAASSAWIAPQALFSQDATSSKIEVLINEPIGPIHKDLYGHFVEHLGAVVYDGIWVGEKSKIPTTTAFERISSTILRCSNPG